MQKKSHSYSRIFWHQRLLLYWTSNPEMYWQIVCMLCFLIHAALAISLLRQALQIVNIMSMSTTVLANFQHSSCVNYRGGSTSTDKWISYLRLRHLRWLLINNHTEPISAHVNRVWNSIWKKGHCCLTSENFGKIGIRSWQTCESVSLFEVLQAVRFM